MIVKIKPSSINGKLAAPPSKSYMQRVCAAALIKPGQTFISNAGKSEDDLHALSIIQQLGARITRSNADELVVESKGLYPEMQIPDVVYFGESGLSLRMFTPLIAISSKEVTITGKGSLLKRKSSIFKDIFPLLGVEFHAQEGFLPFKIKGPLLPSDFKMDGSKSSQFLTGILMAFSSLNAAGKQIEIENLKSFPYIDLTLSILKKFNLPVPANINYQRFTFPSSTLDSSQPVNCKIEGDWSSASFLLAAAAIDGKINLSGLDLYSYQSDKIFLTLLKKAGCKLLVHPDQIEVETAAIQPFYFDATHCPDLFPPLVVLAANCPGKSVIKGLGRLKDKESDRGLSLQAEFLKMGVAIKLDYKADEMKIEGGKKLKAGIFDSHQDHRIAMACAIAALNAEGESKIINAESVNKSYPAFWDDLKRAGADIEIVG